MRRNLAAFTQPDISGPGFVSINTSEDEREVEIHVRSTPRAGEVYGSEATIKMSRADFALLLVSAASRFD